MKKLIICLSSWYFIICICGCTITNTKRTDYANVNYFDDEIMFVMYKDQEMLIAKNHFTDLEKCISENPKVKDALFGESPKPDTFKLEKYLESEVPDSLKIRRKVLRRGLNLTEVPEGLFPNEHQFSFVICINNDGLPIVSKLISTTSEERIINESFQKMSLNYLYEANYEGDCLVCGKMRFTISNQRPPGVFN